MGIGYEGLMIDDFVQGLTECGVELLVDVRLNPISRKPGFSKRHLAYALEQSGIDYVHSPTLGNPKWNRSGFYGTPDDVRVARRAFGELLDNDAATECIRWIADQASIRSVALLCFERSEERCHRHVVLDKVREASDSTVRV